MCLWFFKNPSAASSSSSLFGWPQHEPRGAMDVRRYEPPSPGPLCNTAYLFPPAPYVRIPPTLGRRTLLQPRDETPTPWRCPAEMLRHPMDMPQRKMSRRAKAKVQFRERVSYVAQRLSGIDWTGWEQVAPVERSPSEDCEAFWCSLRDCTAAEAKHPLATLPEIVPLPPMFG